MENQKEKSDDSAINDPAEVTTIVGFASIMLDGVDIAGTIERYEFFLSVMPVLDPSRYMKEGGDARQVVKVLKAALSLQSIATEMKGNIKTFGTLGKQVAGATAPRGTPIAVGTKPPGESQESTIELRSSIKSLKDRIAVLDADLLRERTELNETKKSIKNFMEVLKNPERALDFVPALVRLETAGNLPDHFIKMTGTK